MNTKYIYKISNYLFICMLALAVFACKDFNDNDGTHPKKGFKEIAKKIASFLIANKTF